MNLIISNHNFRYETEKVVRIFFPCEKIIFCSGDDGKQGNYIYTDISGGIITVEVSLGGFRRKKCTDASGFSKKQCELEIASHIYFFLCEYCGFVPDWGIMTGIRPAKLFRHLESTLGREKAEETFVNDYFVSDKKLQLCKSVSSAEDAVISSSRPESFSLYVSIPFCPTRCRYCSFVSHSIEKTQKLIPEYTEKLCKELEITAKYANFNNLRLETVYIGGGTPTTLDIIQLKKIFDCIAENYNLSTCTEYTVEAGRPDTLDYEKLRAIKNSACTRISINPQTFNDDVLEKIGRRHTSAQTEKAYEIARSLDFENINMDLIAGLYGDSFDSFCNSVKKAVKLNPESITVHSLSLKSSSDLVTGEEYKSQALSTEASKMINFAYDALKSAGYQPYYMYRQSKTVGNLENTGWAKPGKFCRYNVFMMDETHTVLAVGAGAVTKLKNPESGHIERIFNFKYPYEYIGRFDEITERKKLINDFYSGK